MNKSMQALGKSLLGLALLGGVLTLGGCKDADEQANADLQQSRDKQMAGMAAGGTKPSGYDAAKGAAPK